MIFVLILIAVLLVVLNWQVYLARVPRVEILRKVNKQWVHESWVKEGSDKVLEALHAPGWAVRYRNGQVDIGRQI